MRQLLRSGKNSLLVALVLMFTAYNSLAVAPTGAERERLINMSTAELKAYLKTRSDLSVAESDKIMNEHFKREMAKQKQSATVSLDSAIAALRTKSTPEKVSTELQQEIKVAGTKIVSGQKFWVPGMNGLKADDVTRMLSSASKLDNVKASLEQLIHNGLSADQAARIYIAKEYADKLVSKPPNKPLPKPPVK